MEATFCDEQVAAEADSVNGEDTSELLAGLLTVTPAIAGIATETATEEATKSARVMFIGFL
ncbi:MAG TPA: hypothetical protein VMD55_07155 [Terracidiphilus sp.]|nr:hypothetical protein [Terracidiphilus sp.]